MSHGKYLSLEEARNAGNLKQFAKEHPSKGDERFEPFLDAMCKGLPPKKKPVKRRTSGAETSED